MNRLMAQVWKDMLQKGEGATIPEHVVALWDRGEGTFGSRWPQRVSDFHMMLMTVVADELLDLRKAHHRELEVIREHLGIEPGAKKKRKLRLPDVAKGTSDPVVVNT